MPSSFGFAQLSHSAEEREEVLKAGIQRFKNPPGKTHDDQARRLLMHATLHTLLSAEHLGLSGAIKQVSTLAHVSHMRLHHMFQWWEEHGTGKPPLWK